MRRASCSCFVACSRLLTCFTEKLRISTVSRPFTHRDDALASRRQLLQKCSSATSSVPTSPSPGCASSPTIRTRGSVGVSNVSQLSHHMSFSIQLLPIRRIAGTFDPRVPQNVGRQPWHVRENRQWLGPQAKGLRGRQKQFLRVALTWQTASSAQRHSAKTRH